MRKKVYEHFPMFGLLVETLLVVYLVIALSEVFTEDTPSTVGGILYSVFIVIVCLMIYFTDITRVYIIDGSRFLVSRRAFPFLVVTNVWFDMPVSLRIGQKSAGRDSLVRIHIDDGNKTFALTRARVHTPSKAALLVEQIEFSDEQIKFHETA